MATATSELDQAQTSAVYQEEVYSNQPRKLSLDMQIETPENVILTYQLAGPAQRYLAYLIDLIIRMVVMFGLLMFVMPMMSLVLPGTALGLFLVLMFLNTWGYYTISEGFFKGQSIGKHFCGIRVIREGGYPITF